jgi:hypothetical protein
MNLQALKPNKFGTTTIAVTTTSQAVAVPNGAGIVLAFQNRGGGDAFVEFGNNNQVVAVAGVAGNTGSSPVLANVPCQQYTMPTGTTHVGIVGGANCTVYMTRGEIA